MRISVLVSLSMKKVIEGMMESPSRGSPWKKKLVWDATQIPFSIEINEEHITKHFRPRPWKTVSCNGKDRFIGAPGPPLMS